MSNQRPPSIDVTFAPPRSAISPAAAMSHGDSPPCWMKASKRPFPTYDSAMAAEPIDRGIRMALRTFRFRVAADRPDSAIETTKSESVSLSDHSIAKLSVPSVDISIAGPPAVAANVSPRVGSCTTPTYGRPATTKPIDTQKHGMPLAVSTDH